VMNSEVEIFVITNGRSTFPYALKSAENQDIDVKITVIRNMKWVDALRQCLQECQSTYYLRQDDDMFIHPFCVRYLLQKAKKVRNLCAYIGKLWEDWSGRPGGNIKLYKTEPTRRIGFTTNKLGKVDKPFFRKVAKTKYRAIKDKSLVGLHACGTRKDEAHYKRLWLKNNARVYYDEPKELDRARKRYKKNIEQQYQLLNILKNKNKKYGFYKYIK